jgi:hypothetical protein
MPGHPHAPSGAGRARCRRALAAAALSAATLVVAAAPLAPAAGHPLAPALLELEARADGRVDVHWKTSRLRPRGVELAPRLPEDCARTAAARTGGDEQSVSTRWTVDCGPRGLVGRSVGVEGLGPVPIDVVLRIALSDGRVVNRILRSGEPELVVPARPAKRAVFDSYLRLGVDHILGGPDHLLFVLGLLLLVLRPRPLVKTVTAFTIGHSVTLSLVALGLARVPSGPVELLIAISVLVLAVEIADAGEGDAPDAIRRRPWWMAFGFGLLHGMGFAGALAEVGLPQAEIPLALLAFNVGIELGQLAFVALVGVGYLALRSRLARLPSGWLRVPAYAIGSCAALWCFERAATLL